MLRDNFKIQLIKLQQPIAVSKTQVDDINPLVVDEPSTVEDFTFDSADLGLSTIKEELVFHGTNEIPRSNFSNKLAWFNALANSHKRSFFPRTRDKDKSKRNNLLSSFNKLWQREYSSHFFKDLGIQFDWLYNKLNNMGRGHRVRGMQLYFHRINYRYKFWTFWQRSILGFVYYHFCRDFKIVYSLIKAGLIFVNGRVVTDPFVIVNKLSIVKIDMSPFLFIAFALLVWKLRKVSPKSFIKKSFFLKFSPSTNVEVSFKLGEYFIMPLEYADREVKRSFLELHFNLSLLFSQRFYPKQNGFGLGRLI